MVAKEAEVEVAVAKGVKGVVAADRAGEDEGAHVAVGVVMPEVNAVMLRLITVSGPLISLSQGPTSNKVATLQQIANITQVQAPQVTKMVHPIIRMGHLGLRK